MLRFTVFAAALAALALAPASFAQANPTTDIAQAWRTFGTVKSYHADVKAPNNRDVSMDVIVPNKMHVTMSQGMQVIRIDSDTWMYREGSWMKLPMAMPQMGAIGDSARNMGFKAKLEPDDYTVTYLGPAAVNSTPAQHYRVARKDGSTKPVEIWIGSNHLPLEVMTQGDNGPMTIFYSKFNAVADITAPM